MTMPMEVVLVRHGQSEQNLDVHAARAKDYSLWNETYRNRPVSQHRLSPLGRQQAAQAGKWLHENQLGYFDRRHVSDYARAKETAALLKVDGPGWYVDHFLREREWGDLDGLSWEEREDQAQDFFRKKAIDPFYGAPPNGESMAQLAIRLRIIFDTWHRECSDKRVIVVCHGEVMWGFRYLIERMTTERWVELESSDAPGDKIGNCQILHYTRRDPDTGVLAPHLNWMRSVSPTDKAMSGPGWTAIERKRFSDAELQAAATRIPQLFKYDSKGQPRPV